MSETQARAILIQSNSTYNIIAASKRASENSINGRRSQHTRGVGSIIGAVFIVLIILSAFAFYAATVNSTQQYNNTISSMSAMDWNRNQEHVVIKHIAVTTTNHLNVAIENDGPIQSQLIWLGIFNETATPENQTYQALNQFVGPSQTANIVSNVAVTLGDQYLIQLITELGNTVDCNFYPANYVNCALTLVTGSPTVYQGNNVTVLLTVTANDTSVDSIQNLTATINATPTGLVQLVSNSPLSVTGLTQGTSAFFWWVYNAVGTGTVSFNASYLQAPAGTYALSTVQIISPAQQGGQGNVTITGVNCTAFQNPSTWTLLGSTQNVSGSISSLSINDTNYAVFNSYYNGTSSNINHFVDNNSSNIDSKGNVGTGTNFTALQYGPDQIYDTLTEVNTASAVPETYVYGSGNQNPGSWLNPTYAYDNTTTTAATKASSTSGSWSGYLVINLTATTVGTKIQYMVGRSTNTTNLWTTMTVNVANQTGSWTNVYNSTPVYAGTTYYNLTFPSTMSYTAMELQFYRSGGSASATVSLYEVQAVNATYTPANYQLALEAQWLNVEYSQLNAQLCIYTGSMGSNALGVDYWNGSSWINLISNLGASAWNNVSVALTSSTFTIRFEAGIYSHDTVQSSWNVDVALLHLWTNQYLAQVEFADFADPQNWTQFVWLTDSSWSVSSVNVTAQLFNFAINKYPTSGDGYVSYTSAASSYTDQSTNQTVTSNPTNFRNSTGWWKVEITGVASIQFQMNVNWIELRDSYAYVNDSIPYKSLVWYTIQATATNGNPIPFTYTSLYANGTTVALQNATSGTSIPNPAWLQLDANGTFQLQLGSTTSSGEAFVLYVAVGAVVQQKTITQAAQQ